jgi:hypothetical protein
MGAIELKRCPHCMRTLTPLQIDEREEFARSGPALVCARCDTDPPLEELLLLPDAWD